MALSISPDEKNGGLDLSDSSPDGKVWKNSRSVFEVKY